MSDQKKKQGRKKVPYLVKIDRLRKLIDKEKSRQVIADSFGCNVSTITKHYNGDNPVDLEMLYNYAKYFNVSTDYLLGLSDTSLSIGDKIYWANIPEDNSSIKDASIEEQIVNEIGDKGFWSSHIDYDCDLGDDYNHYADIGKIFFHTAQEAQEAIINKIKTLIGIGIVQTEEEE